MTPITRAEARRQGLTQYFTGKPCLRGHIEARTISTGRCLLCGREGSAQYRESNAEAVALEKRRSYAANREANLAYMRAYREKNREKLRLSRAAWYAENKELSAERSREYLANNRDAQLARMKRYREERPDVRTALEAKRRARKRNAVPAWFSEIDVFVWQEAAHLAILRRDATGIDWAADHMLALQGKLVCGLHVADNCQVIPAYLNNRKHNKMLLTEPDEWLRHL